MALLAEQLVDEWLNRNGFFTMRGVRMGVDEIDLLAIKPNGNSYEARHIEVQISFRPISYISKLNKNNQQILNATGANSSKKRPENILKESVEEWIETKFTSKKKIEMRDHVLKNLDWKFSFVHAEVHEPQELKFMEEKNIKLIPFKDIVSELFKDERKMSAGAATDIVEIVKYHSETLRQEHKP